MVGRWLWRKNKLKTDTRVICNFCKKELDTRSEAVQSGDTLTIKLGVDPCESCLSNIMDQAVKDLKQKYKSKYDPAPEEPD